MTRIKDPKQVANIIRHILLILISSLRVCFMAGRRGWRMPRALCGNEGPVCRRLRGSGGTDEDCLPVNELNTSNMERTTSGLKEGWFVLGANERVHVCTWIYEHNSKLLFVVMAPCLSWLYDQHKETFKIRTKYKNITSLNRDRYRLNVCNIVYWAYTPMACFGCQFLTVCIS